MDDLFDMSSEDYKKFVEYLKRNIEPKSEEEMAENLSKIKEELRNMKEH